VVLAVAGGQTTVQAECEGTVAEVVVEIRPINGTLSILPGSGALAAGQVVGLGVVWKTGAGSPAPALGASWSTSDPAVLRISVDGELTAVRPGTARVVATVGAQAAEVEYLVTRVDVASVRIMPKIGVLSVGEEVRLETHAADRLGSVLTGRVVTWHSSDPKVVVVAPDGTIRGVGTGLARISAVIGAGLAAIDLRVNPATVGGIRIAPASLALRVGEAALLKASVQGSRGATLPGVGVEWQSSDPQIASVSPEGVVRGLRFGTVRIAASAGGRRATVAVEVRSATVTTISAPRVRVVGEKA
jgi:Bacterial Ig-like domain (group 2)